MGIQLGLISLSPWVQLPPPLPNLDGSLNGRASGFEPLYEGSIPSPSSILNAGVVFNGLAYLASTQTVRVRIPSPAPVIRVNTANPKSTQILIINLL